MIKNLIFDFGGVLGHFNEDVLITPYIKDEETKRIVGEVIFDRLYWDRLDMGTISDAEIHEGIKKRLTNDLIDVALEIYDNWVYNLQPVSGMCKLVEEISQNSNIKLYLLSDISKDFEFKYKRVEWIKDLFSHFECLTFSGVEGLVKPHKETFENLLSKCGIKAAESLFIDDNPRNISGAESCGINGYWFDGDVDKLRGYLKYII